MQRQAVRALLMVCVLVAASPALAQDAAPLTGTWVLQADATAARSRRAINGISIATRLVIRQSTAEITVESNTGTDGAIVVTTLALDGGEHAVPGPIGWDTRAKSRFEGGRFVVDIKRTVQGPDGALTFDIKEVYAPTGDTLTLERSQGKTVQTLVYKRS